MPVDTYDLWLDPAFKMSTRMNLTKNDDPDSAMELKQRSATALTESLLDRMPSMSGLGCLSLAPPKTFFDCPLNGRENHTHSFRSLLATAAFGAAWAFSAVAARPPPIVFERAFTHFDLVSTAVAVVMIRGTTIYLMKNCC